MITVNTHRTRTAWTRSRTHGARYKRPGREEDERGRQGTRDSERGERCRWRGQKTEPENERDQNKTAALTGKARERARTRERQRGSVPHTTNKTVDPMLRNEVKIKETDHIDSQRKRKRKRENLCSSHVTTCAHGEGGVGGCHRDTNRCAPDVLRRSPLRR